MKTSEKQFVDLENKIISGLKLTYKRLIEFKKQKKSHLVVQRDGKIIKIKAEEL
jgi:hypothetical protein